MIVSIPLKAVPKGRPRFTGSGKCYTPKETLIFERQVRTLLAGKFKVIPAPKPVAISMVFQIEKPKSCKRRSPSVRPDLDNYVKAVQDSLNGIAFEDDGQITVLNAVKVYGTKSNISISVEEWT